MMATYVAVMDLAHKVAEQRLHVQIMGMANTSNDPVKATKASALFMVQRDKLRELEAQYDAAKRAWVDAGMPEPSGSTEPGQPGTESS